MHLNGYMVIAPGRALIALQRMANCMSHRAGSNQQTTPEGIIWSALRSASESPVRFIREAAGYLAMASESPLSHVGSMPEAAIVPEAGCREIEVTLRPSDHAPTWVHLKV